MKKLLATLLLCATLLTIFTGCQKRSATENSADNELSGTYSVTLWVSEVDGVAAMTKKQIDAFQTAHPGIQIKASIEGVAEADAANKILTDVASAPDIYCFAQDQLARLVQAAALAMPGQQAQQFIRENNDAASVEAASVAGQIYAYPLTADNGYYMYYDTSIISNPDDLDAIIADCEAHGKKLRFGLEDAWFMASFFFATGCRSQWDMNAQGQFTGVQDNFNSPEGLIAMQAMQKLSQSKAYDANNNIFTDAAVVITGIWNANAAQAHFGKNLGATDLPSFTVDGKSYHLGSFTGNKLMGIKPQSDPKKAAVLALLTQYLTGETCQLERYGQFQWGPSNLSAQKSPEVARNVSLSALAKQKEYAVLQGQIHGSWWDIAKVLGAQAKAAKNTQDLQKALTDYEATITGLLPHGN